MCIKVGGGGGGIWIVSRYKGRKHLRWVVNIAKKQQRVRRAWFPCLLLEKGYYGRVRVRSTKINTTRHGEGVPAKGATLR